MIAEDHFESTFGSRPDHYGLEQTDGADGTFQILHHLRIQPSKIVSLWRDRFDRELRYHVAPGGVGWYCSRIRDLRMDTWRGYVEFVLLLLLGQHRYGSALWFLADFDVEGFLSGSLAPKRVAFVIAQSILEFPVTTVLLPEIQPPLGDWIYSRGNQTQTFRASSTCSCDLVELHASSHMQISEALWR